MGIALTQDLRYVNEDTRSIVEAINHSGQISADKIEGMQRSVSELAKSVHELAISNNYLSKDVETIQLDVKQINARLTKIEPAAESMKEIKSIFLRWIVPIMLIGSMGGGIVYTFFK